MDDGHLKPAEKKGSPSGVGLTATHKSHSVAHDVDSNVNNETCVGPPSPPAMLVHNLLPDNIMGDIFNTQGEDI